jgi:hypothetical protein
MKDKFSVKSSNLTFKKSVKADGFPCFTIN